MRNLFLICALALCSISSPLRAEVVPVHSPAEAVALVADAIEAVRARQAALPPPASDSEELVRMVELDQAPRLVLARLDLGELEEAEKRQMWGDVWQMIIPIDRQNQARLLEMVPAEGWFAISRYGKEAANAAFLIVQHADEALWRRFLPKIEDMAKSGEAEGGAFALMYDRLALSEGRPQRYGSQMTCEDGRWVVEEPVEDWDAIDAQRSSVGLSTLAENLKRFEGRGC